jgi:hypothetical protein
MANVVLVCGEMNKMIDSVFWGIAARTPTYFPPPPSTIVEISASLEGIVTAFPLSLCVLYIVPNHYARRFIPAQLADSADTLLGQPTKYVTLTRNQPPDFSPISHRYPLVPSPLVISRSSADEYALKQEIKPS